MTYTELEQKLGKQLVKSDWRQASGGGWIYKTAKVDNEENIRDNAIVMDDAWVYEDAMIFGDAQIIKGEMD
jgi:hypothetical protein